MAQPFPDDTFDVAVMPLVVFFVPDPAKGVAEMVRVVCLGGTVTASAWDMYGGGFPYEVLQAEMRARYYRSATAKSGASRIESMRDLWTDAGLNEVETREITVQRTFVDFHDYWTTILKGPNVGSKAAEQWRPKTSPFSKRGCASACRQMPWVASPIVPGLTR